MSSNKFCELFRTLIYDRSERKVMKQEHFMNGHESTCLACVRWLLDEVAFVEEDHETRNHELDADELRSLKRAKAKLLAREKKLAKQEQGSDIGMIEPTNADLLKIANEGTLSQDVPEPAKPEDGESQACSA